MKTGCRRYGFIGGRQESGTCEELIRMTAETSPVLQVSLPHSLLHYINELDYGNNLEEKIQISLAIRLYEDKHINLEQAAELSGKSMVQLIDILNRHHIPGMEYKVKLLKKERGKTNRTKGKNSAL
jgi:predicted HTH domain antitoxin